MREKREKNVKIALVMRGTPGSGKSTFSNFLKNECGASVHEVDQLHTDSGKFMLRSDDVLTFMEPNSKLVDHYKTLTK